MIPKVVLLLGIFGFCSCSTTTVAPQDIIMPHFEVAVGTTLRSRDGSPISDTCSDFYAEEIRNKAQKRVDEINRKIETEELCGGNRGIAAFSVNTALSTHENTGTTKLSYDVGVSDDSVTLKELRECGDSVSTYVENFNSYEQPIIPSIEGCPDVVFDTSSFVKAGNRWVCLGV